MPGGYPWAQGDLLLANDLNAAIADATAISGPPGSTAGWPFLPLTGGSPMTGPLTLSGNATLPLHAVPLQQVNTAAAGGPFLPLSGGTVTGMANFNAGTTHGAAPNNIVTVAPGATTAATSWITAAGPLGIGSASSSPYGVNIGYGPGPFGNIATANANTGGNANDGATGNVFTVNNILRSNFYRTPALTYNGSGNAGPSILTVVANYTGNFSSSAQGISVSIPTDTVAAGATPNYPNPFAISHNFGGGGATGGRVAGSMLLAQTGAVNSPGSFFVTLNPWFQSNFNAGGTGPGQQSGGYASTLNPQVLLRAGATYFAQANALGEIDITVTGTQQTCTIAGSATTGDVISLTFTNAAITGSPVTVAYTTGASQSIPSMAYGIQAAIWGNAALRNAGVSATIAHATGNLTLCWPLEIGTVTVAQSVSGAATETVALGSVTPGASADTKYGMTIVRQAADTGPPMSDSAALWLGDQTTTPAAGWRSIFMIGGNVGQWPLAPKGTIIKAGLPGALGGYGRSQPMAPLFATAGVDFHYVNFTQQSGAALLMPGYTLDGAGNSFYGSAKIGMGAGGLVIDSVGWTGNGNATVVTPGGGGSGASIGNYYVGEIVYDDLGGQHVVAGVNPATGGVTSLTTVVQPSGPAGSAPASTRVTTGGTGVNLTIGVTWVAATGLSLNPTGQHLGFNGTAPVAKPTVTGAKGSNAALASLMTALAAYGLVVDSTSA